jgi:magnesium-protoporphyrin O-methyltransferase
MRDVTSNELTSVCWQMDDMVGHLCSISEKRFIISFAPYTPFYAALKFVGSLAPGPSKATRAYLHAEVPLHLLLGLLIH